MQSSGFMERFNDSEQRGVLDMHGFRGVSEAIKQTGRRLATAMRLSSLHQSEEVVSPGKSDACVHGRSRAAYLLTERGEWFEVRFNRFSA